LKHKSPRHAFTLSDGQFLGPLAVKLGDQPVRHGLGRVFERREETAIHVNNLARFPLSPVGSNQELGFEDNVLP